ncbi:outer membrane beta-barrel protein [Halanaerobiaceae bacterium Z-7014]|uniref:Outer membrane beta-barrel protein n=1 Tax=Halonatronomonas betaini TaxID=2778430 RepID=A0A931AR56_9FIRM|nr:outer membrane beta-barrel protein [Halonatronomonas betaini]MBF8436982.1 outer membrane beta-barrel protein [Halonatronomonas betaini]
MIAKIDRITGYDMKIVMAGVLMMVVLLAGSVSADEPAEIPLQDTKIIAGANLATFEDTNLGFHFYGGAGVPIDDNLFVTGRYERYFAEDLGLNAITANFEYDLARIVTDEFELLRIYAQGNIGYYFGNFADESISGLGIKGGMGAEAEIAGGFGASVNLNFRPLEFEDADVNLTGLEVGLGAFFSF